MNGLEIWQAADTQGRDEKSAHLVRIYALVQMMAEAQSAVVEGDPARTVEHLRAVQAHAEKMVGMLAPGKKSKPTLVAALRCNAP